MDKTKKEDDLLEPTEWNSQTDGLWVPPSDVRKEKEKDKVFKETHNGLSRLDYHLDNALSILFDETINCRGRAVKKSRAESV